MSVKAKMIVNYVPGEECRVAVLHNDALEELHAERSDSASHVGNIYLGRVQNVEAGIQAAFVDFGLGENGFLHVSDLHPRYFPGAEDDEAERVGKKTPRRERPPIQACLKRGQEVIVQVLKEGIGTKGPTLTSYLSIPGKYLVMMPYMDNVGVSRRIEDEDTRKKMRETLDQLDLPEGFGFILRTAGFERTKIELKRDFAYLQRLWKDMETRLKKGGKPRLLYAESDLLLRCLRDVPTTDVDEIVIDDEAALRRAARFLKIVAPRSATKLYHYKDPAPIFHAYGVEDQIKLMHLREVPMRSGGSIVIDEAEALVAIDVNSGKMRDNKDAETTALKTNIEAADEICRQLKLRELGGVVIIDFIDMRKAQHRKQLEQRVRDNLKRDRANTKALTISEFGIMEMTRQRMRGSHRKTHFTGCPTCNGRGLVQRPGSVTAEALREVAAFLAREKVAKVEMVVSPRVAGELLSAARHRLSRMERIAGKQALVRVSNNIGLDELQFFVYDHSGADLEIDRLPALRPPETLEAYADTARAGDEWMLDPLEEAAELARLEAEAELKALDEMRQIELVAASGPIAGIDEMPQEEGAGGKKKRRRRRRRKGKGGAEGVGPGGPGGPGDAHTQQRADDEDDDHDDHDEDESDSPSQGAPDAGSGEASGKKKRRRRRRRKGKGPGGPGEASGGQADDAEQRHVEPKPAPRDDSDDADDDSRERDEGSGVGPKKKRRRRGKKAPTTGGVVEVSVQPAPKPAPAATAKPAAAKPATAGASATPAKKAPRSLYASHRKVKPSEVPQRDD